MNDAMGMPQTAVVLGATSDIARAVLRQLVAQRLRRVVLAGRDQDRLREAADELRALGADQVTTVAFDVTDVAGHAGLAAKAAAELGQIDLVLLTAGVLGRQELDETDPEATAGVLTANTTGPAAALVAFAEVLRRQGHGRLVVLSSVAGVRVRRANFVYGASKAGLDGFAQGLADALHGSGASVLIVRPGFVATRMTAGMAPAPLATTAEAVAADVVRGLQQGTAVVWSPAALRLVFGLARLVPQSLWRRLPS